jgi:hypothetical protein
VVVEDDDIHATSFEPRDGIDAVGTTIDSEQQGGWVLFQAILDSFLAEAIALVHSVREVVAEFPAEGREHFEQESGGGDAVDIVIAEDDNRFTVFTGPKQAVDCGGHIGKEERIGEVFESWLEKIGDGLGLGHFPVKKALSKQRGEAELVG